MSYTERALRLAWRICIVLPFGLMMLIVELMFGIIAAAVYAIFLDFTGSALIRIRLYRNARWEVLAFFGGLHEIARGIEP